MLTKAAPRYRPARGRRRRSIRVWVSASKGPTRLTRMQDTHLVHALFLSLRSGYPKYVVDSLTREVRRRGLEQYATDLAKHRS